MEKRNWLIGARVKAGLSRIQLAEMANYHETYIEKLENGTRMPSVDAAIRIGRVLGFEPADIVHRFVDEKVRRAIST